MYYISYYIPMTTISSTSCKIENVLYRYNGDYTTDINRENQVINFTIDWKYIIRRCNYDKSLT